MAAALCRHRRWLSPSGRPWVAAALGAVAVGFLVIHAFGLRRTGAETFGAPIYWDRWRPAHALLYAGAAALLLVADRAPDCAAGLVLFLDVMLGLVVFTLHHTAMH